MLALFAIFALAVTVMSGSKAAAFAVAAAGAVALLIFLLGDLPRAGQIGTLDDPRQSFIDAEAVPQAGFWLELLGALRARRQRRRAGDAHPRAALPRRALGRARRRERKPEDGDAEEKPDPKKGEKPRDSKEQKASPKRRRRETNEEGSERVKDRVEKARRSGSRRRGED